MRIHRPQNSSECGEIVSNSCISALFLCKLWNNLRLRKLLLHMLAAAARYPGIGVCDQHASGTSAHPRLITHAVRTYCADTQQNTDYCQVTTQGVAIW